MPTPCSQPHLCVLHGAVYESNVVDEDGRGVDALLRHKLALRGKRRKRHIAAILAEVVHKRAVYSVVLVAPLVIALVQAAHGLDPS